MSGSPMPKLMTSMPWAFFSAIFRLISTKRYGGTLSMRLANLMFNSTRLRNRGGRPESGPEE